MRDGERKTPKGTWPLGGQNLGKGTKNKNLTKWGGLGLGKKIRSLKTQKRTCSAPGGKKCDGVTGISKQAMIDRKPPSEC